MIKADKYFLRGDYLILIFRQLNVSLFSGHSFFLIDPLIFILRKLLFLLLFPLFHIDI